MKKLSFLFIIGTIIGCASADKQIFKARQTFDKYPNEAAKYCGDTFPVADSTISVKIDTGKGKIIDYTPALVNLETMLDSARAVLNQKQGSLTSASGQLSFTKTQLGRANSLIDNLTQQISSLKSGYKPCAMDTIKSTYIKIRSNTAKIMALTAEIVAQDQDKTKALKSLNTAEEKSMHRLLLLIGLCLLIAGYFGVKIYGFFSGGGIVNNLFSKVIK